MDSYQLLKHLHLALVIVSGLGFALRGFIRLLLRRRLAHPLVRFGPHLVDTLLLASGVGLWWTVGYSPIDNGWLGLKLLLIVVYVVLGIAAFRLPDARRALALYVAALATFLAVAALAVCKPL